MIKSIIPVSSSPAPIGHSIGLASTPSLSLIVFKLYSKSAPVLSILFAKIIRGTLNSVACLQTVSVCGSTPACASISATAPSNTRSDLDTSTVKST